MTTIEEFYTEIGADYQNVLALLGNNEERVEKFAGMFFNDDTYDSLLEAIEAGNYADAFRFAHTLKGSAANMAFNGIVDTASAVTEGLRPDENGDPKDLPAALELLGNLENEFSKAIEAWNRHIQ